MGKSIENYLAYHYLRITNTETNRLVNIALRLSNEIYKNYERKPEQKINIKSHKYKLNDSKDN